MHIRYRFEGQGGVFVQKVFLTTYIKSKPVLVAALEHKENGQRAKKR